MNPCERGESRRRARAAVSALLCLSFAGCAAGGDAAHAPRPIVEPRVTVVFAPGELALPHERLERWVDDSRAMVRETFGAFPVAELELTIQPRGTSRGIHDG